MYICICHAITDKDIKQAIEDGATTMPCLAKQLGVSTQCGKCKSDVLDIIQETTQSSQNVQQTE